jgi:stage III sporulation protein SpoIIIAA
LVTSEVVGVENLIIGKKALPKAVADLLPRRILWAVEALADDFEIEEIRLRRNGNVWVCRGRENIDLNVKITGEEIDEVLVKACGGSVFRAYAAKYLHRGLLQKDC